MPRRTQTVLAALLLLPALAPAADLPRKAPELVIQINGGNPIQLSRYRGKAVAVCFILTTCPHCQKTIGYLSRMQEAYGAKGFQVLATAIDQGAALAVPNFIRTFTPPFPVGYNDQQVAVDFMQHPPMLIPLMPMLAMIDPQGMIRYQHEGNDEQYFGPNIEQNMRKEIESLLPPAPAAKKRPARKTTKKQS